MTYGKEQWGVSSEEWDDWHWQLSHSGCGWGLMSRLGVATAAMAQAQRRYPMQVTPYYLGLAEALVPTDPILRQVLPDEEELRGDGEDDPFEEVAYFGAPRLVHRYRDRVLFMTTGDCASHCRHCMRKRNWGELPGAADDQVLSAAVSYVRQHPEVREILISGGDPLCLEDSELERILTAFASVETLEVMRLGSRTPAVMPQRLTDGLGELLEGLGKSVFLAAHFNHPRELTSEAAAGVERMLRHGVPVVSQSVLLRGVNDDAETLRRLFTGLLRIKVKPYYLFHGDPIRGTTHFRTGIERGLALLEALRGDVSGLALPAYSFDLPEGGGKIRLEPGCALRRSSSGRLVFTSFEGREIEYV